MNRLRFLGLLGGLLGALAVGSAACDDSSSGGTAAIDLDAGFGLDGPSIDGNHPVDDDAAAEAGPPELTTSVKVPGFPSGAIHGAASADGSAMVVVTGAPNFMTWSHYEPATGWSAPAVVPGGGNFNGLSLAIDGKGNAFLAWTTIGATATLDLVRYDHATQTWSAVQHPDPYAQSFGSYVAVAANASGEALLVALRGGATGPWDVYAQHYTGGTWTPELIATEAGSGLQALQLELTDSGRAFAAWDAPASGGQKLAFRAGGVWTKAVAPALALTADMTMNDSGDFVAGWEDTSYLPQGYAYDGASATWTGPTTLSSVSESSKAGECPFRVGIGPNGDAVYARCFSEASTVTLESYSYTKSSKTWGPKTTVSGAGVVRFNDLGFDATGAGYGVWFSYPDVNLTNPVPVSSSFSPGTGWSAQSAALGGTAVGKPAVLVSPNGRAFAVWYEGSDVMIRKIH